MISTHEHYSELLALTKRYLLQEYALNDRIFSEAETYSYFKTYALQNQKKAVPDKLGPMKVVTSYHTPKEESVAGPDKSGLMKAVTSHRTPKEENGPDKSGPMKAMTSHHTPTLVADFTELRKIMREKLPHVQLLDHLPDDTEAKELANSWTKAKQTAQVLILSFDEPPKHQLFLANISKALQMFGFHTSISNAKKIEWQNTLRSKDLKLVVSSSSGFYHLPELQKHHREDARQGRHYLGDHPLLLLSDISFYLKEPGLKPSLWKALKELLAIS